MNEKRVLTATVASYSFSLAKKAYLPTTIQHLPVEDRSVDGVAKVLRTLIRKVLEKEARE